MNEMLNEIPEISRREVAEAIVRGRRERSEFIATALRGLFRRLREPRRASLPTRATPC